MGDEGTIPEPARRGPTLVGRRYAVPLLAALGLAAVAAIHFGVPLLSSGASSRDDVSPQETARRLAAFAAMRPVPLALVPPEQREKAIASLGLAGDAQAKAKADLDAGRIHFAWLALYDSDAQDGDAVTVASGGFSKSLVLTKAPITIAVPVPASGFVELTGIIDGAGGGVTVGVVTPAGPVPLPPMSVGQTIRLPVAAP